MLALRPTSPARPPDMLQCRGRSRQVSHAALARQASEERCYAVGAIHRKFFARSTPERTNSLLQPCLTDEKPALLPFTQPPPPPYTNDCHSPTILSIVPQPVAEPEVMPIAAPVPMRAAFTPHFIRSESPSPPSSASMSPDYYDSPPSPPRSLEDQVHVAYAHDDIHLAKILLLRLKGIEVTSDDDPRIAEVRDEDFDFCFVPNGGLMDERDEKWMLERQREERERLEGRRRLERLKACERIWVDVKRRLREERMMILRRREMSRVQEEERRRKYEEEQRRRVEEERRRMVCERAEAERASERASARVRARAERKVVSYNFLQPTSDSPGPSQTRNVQPAPFVYNFMVSTHPRTIKTPTSCSPPKSISHVRPHFPTPSFDDSRCIPFADVLKSMQGPLFPLSHEERMQRSGSPAHSRSSTRNSRSQLKRRREVELLDSLLNVECKGDERRRKSKLKAKPRRPIGTCAACCASSSSGSLPSPASPSSPTSRSGSLPRASSWLSFRSSSTSSSSSISSASTNITTPSTSPIAAPKANWFITTSVPSFASRRPKSTSVSIPVSEPVALHTCHSHSHLTPISPSEGPLSIAPRSPERKAYSAAHEGAPRGGREERSTSSSPTRKESGSRVGRRMSQLVELAKGLPSLFGVSASNESFEEHQIRCGVAMMEEGLVHDGVISGEGVPVSTTQRKMRLRPAGYRVRAGDVAAFLSRARSQPASSSGDTLPLLGTHQTEEEGERDDVFCSPIPRYIPLSSPCSSSNPPRTVLPNPLPYPLVFKPIPPPVRSPFCFQAMVHQHTTYPSSVPLAFASGGVSIRLRAVGNPMYLRLKALHNIVWTRGGLWEGRGRETSLGGGRERVVGVAFEGVGKSALPINVLCG